MHRRLLFAMLATATLLPAQSPELGQGYLSEFQLAARQTVQLADAIPDDKFGWRPGPGVRSVSEVLMHVALGNYYLLAEAGVPLPEGARTVKQGLEKSVTAKADVVGWLKDSQEAVTKAYAKADLKKPVKFFTGKEVPTEGVYLRILVHNHEHMGQLVAYARTMGVVPPWSATPQ